MFKIAYYDEDAKDILNKEISSIKEFKEVVSKVYSNILPKETDSITTKIGKLTEFNVVRL